MTEKSGPATKKAAEERTAAENEADRHQQALQSADSAAEKVDKDRQAGDTDEVSGAVLTNPFPAYEDRSLEDLRSLAESRGVEINRDVEKANLVVKLRQKEPNPQWDLLRLEDLRSAASERDVALDPELEKAHLVTELRAADTGAGPAVQINRR